MSPLRGSPAAAAAGWARAQNRPFRTETGQQRSNFGRKGRPFAPKPTFAGPKSIAADRSEGAAWLGLDLYVRFKTVVVRALGPVFGDRLWAGYGRILALRVDLFGQNSIAADRFRSLRADFGVVVRALCRRFAARLRAGAPSAQFNRSL